jgi:peptide/nickel transport system permease protein
LTETQEVTVRANRGLLRGSAFALRRNPNMLLGAVILSVVVVIAVLSPYLVRTNPSELNPFERLQPPSSAHWFGADHLGRDVFDRTLVGSRVSLLVGFSVGFITSVAGLAIGLVAGYYRRLDNVIMRFMDGLMAFPSLLLALALIAVLGASVLNVILVICVVDTPRMVRVVRGSVLTLREQQFVEAANAIGTPAWRIMLRHIAPNTFAPVMVQATFIFALAIIVEANLSFLGAGVPPSIPSWGNIMGQGRTYLQIAVWVTFFPGLFLSLSVLSINLVGDGLRDTLDPRFSRRA